MMARESDTARATVASDIEWWRARGRRSPGPIAGFAARFRPRRRRFGATRPTFWNISTPTGSPPFSNGSEAQHRGTCQTGPPSPQYHDGGDAANSVCHQARGALGYRSPVACGV